MACVTAEGDNPCSRAARENLSFKRVALFDQCFLPVCSADVARRLRGIGDLAHERLLHEADTSRWTGWLNAVADGSFAPTAAWDGATGPLTFLGRELP